MDEKQWLACNKTAMLLRHVRSLPINRRRFLWFNCACCRRIWHLLGKHSRRFVEIVEQYAGDANCPLPSLGVDWEGEQATNDWRDNLPTHERQACISALWAASHLKGGDNQTADLAAVAVARLAPKGKRLAAKAAEESLQCNILRDIFGNPFRRVTISPAWLTWNDATVVRLAKAAYDERTLPVGMLDNTQLAILADALEEAGCTDAQILTHLRGGDHYRGCWVLDLLLGKN